MSTNDVVLSTPYQAGFGQQIASVAQGTSVPASLSLSKGETATSWGVNWGDGTTNTSTSPLLTHTYNNLGTYVISGTAQVGSPAVTHTGTGSVYDIAITPSITTTTSGTYPLLTTTFSNGTSILNPQKVAGASPWVQGGGTISVSATISAPPPNTAWVPQTTSLMTSFGTLTTTTATAAGASGTVVFPQGSPGTYTITFVSPIENTLSSVIVYQNYTWTVFVSPANLPALCGSCLTSGSNSGAVDPHPGTIDTYEVVPGGATSIDPAIDYESVGYEVIANVYQTLVYYNGSSSASFIPEIATCVPGSAQCSSLYGSSLVVNNGATGLPEYWTFVIDKNANFYDPAHSASWGVYPTDVMASLARTASFADLPFFASNPGWIQTQSYTNYGNSTWDGGIHYPFNNTPQGVLGAMLINDSQYCPAAAMTSEHGCITINAWGAGSDWPFFLELVSDPDGGGIIPCGWFGAQGAGLPGFTTSAAYGDGPCLLPDGGTTTNNSAWSSYLSSTAPTAWDTYQENAYNTPNVFPSVRFSAVGSGPYYVVSINKGVGYVLQANPAYGQPNCAGLTWCQPAPGMYAHTVNVFWEPSDQVGIQEYLQGQADFASIQTSDTGTLLNLQAAGKIGVTNVPTINVFFDPINMGVNLNQISGYYTGSYNMPSSTGAGTSSDFFSAIGLREFLVNSFPYTQDLQQVLSVDGIVYGLNYGGAIPHFMGNYYAQNVTWPAGQPNFNATQVGGAAWWWAQANNPTSPYYDPQLADCTSAAPCTFPVEGEQADTLQNGQFPIWESYISAISGGHVKVAQEVDLTFAQLVQYFLASTAYVSPLTISVLGWLPDYPDPTDYVAPMYLPDATYTGPDAVGQVLANYTAASSGSIACPSGDSWANLTYWANQPGVPQVCQGDAYGVMTWASEVAGALPTGANRTLWYNEVSHIANSLALYIYQFQEQGIGTFAPWINPNTIDTNVVLAGDALWFQIGGNGLLP